MLATVFDDGVRRGDGARVLVTHTMTDYATPHLENPAAAADAISPAVGCHFALPDPVDVPLHVHRWTYAAPPLTSRSPYHLDDHLIGLCGDAWAPPALETTWLSGTRLGTALAARL